MLTPALLFLSLIADQTSSSSDLATRVRAADAQVRAEALYELADKPSLREHASLLYGRTVEESLRFLGPPSEVAVLNYAGVSWLRHTYWLPATPLTLSNAGVPASALRSYSLSVLFRNGRSVPYTVFEAEHHMLLTYAETYPRSLEFTVVAPARAPASK